MKRITKVLNSSVVLVKDENNFEYILLGKGIGYGQKPGALMEDNETNQMFVPISMETKTNQALELLQSIPVEILQITQEIITEAKGYLHVELSKNLYFVLADHLNFAIERLRDNIVITNRVFWEIKNYYPKEFNVGLIGLSKIQKRLGILLPEEEAANIAFHLANATASNDSYDAQKYSKVIGEIVHIVVYSMNKVLDKESIHYMRFITHIKFLVERYFTNNMLNNEDSMLYVQMKSGYAMEIAEKIKEYLLSKYGREITNEELAFLAVHLNRIINQ
ncbi:PRD domain-containing protein [Niallia circulans]|uniref:PRD domain-containing protein n=1 Tax=Niallia circulans TaxID=1397 RepID=A0A941GEX6_NIACI|nr:PRD domain-containing protein [Niallia circulans]MCB5237649.1 PRD domain-containing protein [Niallia circulans]